jgi:hypothetical protein
MSEEALADMGYAEGVVREAMRVAPIIGGFPRKALQASALLLLLG